MPEKNVGSAKGKMQAVKNKHTVDVVSKAHYLVIGFEVNVKNAFSCKKVQKMKFEIGETCTHNVNGDNGDFGHAFFYVSDNKGEVMVFLALDQVKEKIKLNGQFRNFLNCIDLLSPKKLLITLSMR